MVNVKKDSLVSVITATLNAGKYLHEALNSISNQTYQNFEVLIIEIKFVQRENLTQ